MVGRKEDVAVTNTGMELFRSQEKWRMGYYYGDRRR